jgi:hypothetical protein
VSAGRVTVFAVRPLLLILSATALVAGCGSSQPRLTRAEFTQRANAVCARYTALVQGVVGSASQSNLASVEAAVTQALPVVRAGNDELRTLRPPAELQDAYNRWLDTSDRQVKGLQQLEDAAAKSDVNGVVAGLKTLAGTNVEQARLDTETLGLTSCSTAAAR